MSESDKFVGKCIVFGLSLVFTLLLTLDMTTQYLDYKVKIAAINALKTNVSLQINSKDIERLFK